MIERYLSIIEVSQKQAYIFGSNKLAENIRRSAEISWLTDPQRIQELIGDGAVFNHVLNTVYSGGGHTVLTFETLDKARDFNSRYSFLLRLMNPEIDVFLFTLPYCSKVSAEKMLEYVCTAKSRSQEMDCLFATQESVKEASPSDCSPDRYLKELVRGLERKKSLRLASFRQGSFGVEYLEADTRGIVAGRKKLPFSSKKPGRDEEELIKFIWRSEYDGSGCDEDAQKCKAAQYYELKRRYRKDDTSKHDKLNGIVDQRNPVPREYAAATKFENLGGTKGDVNFLAVVHIDGNGMGARCNAFYEGLQKVNIERKGEGKDEKARWEYFTAKVKEFSDGIDNDFKTALSKTFARIDNRLKDRKLQELSLKIDEKTGKPFFPIRGIIASGDDICFVTDGRIGIECAAIFLEELAALENNADKKSYSASAGVAIVHQKYPFFRAYELAEELCSNAKSFAADIRVKQKDLFNSLNESDAIVPEILQDNGAGICAIDWHLEMGEIGMSVSEIRKEYQTKDAVNGKPRHLEMRPYIVAAPVDLAPPADVRTIESHRQYDVFRKQMERYLNTDKPSGADPEDVHSKLKQLRSVLKQGETEAQHYIRFHKLNGQIVNNYYGIFRDVQFLENPEKLPLYVKTADGEERSVLFDAAEVLEVYSPM